MHTPKETRSPSLVRYCTERAKIYASQSADCAGCKVSKSDLISFAFSFGLGCEILFQHHPCPPSVVGAFKRLLNNILCAQDLLGYIDACSYLREQLRSGKVLSNIPLTGIEHRWARVIVNTLLQCVDESLCTHPSPRFNSLMTFLGWLKRIPVCTSDTSDNVSRYIGCDARIREINFVDNAYIAPLRQIWKEWFSDFRIREPFLPRHGSGSTADVGRVRANKWRALTMDRRARVLLRYPSLERIWDDMTVTDTKCISKVVFVPKAAGKTRTICMEPSWLQFLQQGVAKQIVSYTHGEHPLRKLVNIYSQDVNRRLCGVAYHMGYSTIDLSDASDSVSWSLIKALCGELPLLRYLYATRSDITLLDGVQYRFEKYAPMGSALCFPIECILFASVVELAHRIHYGETGACNRCGYAVYGDDIICPSEVYHLVVDILQSIGFVVNEQKSFSSGPYYESCGCEYLYGFLIETVRHPRAHLHYEGDVSPSQIGLITDLANSLYDAGYFRARRALLCSYQEKYVRIGNRRHRFMDLMQFDDIHCRSIMHDFSRGTWSSKLQCRVVERKICEAAPRKSSEDYTEYLYNALLRPPKGPISVMDNWSANGLTFLLGHHFDDILTRGEVEAVGSSNAGQLAYRVRRIVKPRRQN